MTDARTREVGATPEMMFYNTISTNMQFLYNVKQQRRPLFSYQFGSNNEWTNGNSFCEMLFVCKQWRTWRRCEALWL